MSLTGPEKSALLEMARSSIEARVKGTALGAGKEVESENLLQDAGAFVTIRRHGRLRGCLGTFSSSVPLYKTVMEMAAAAASQDPRFPPMDEGELKDMEIEVSVLSPLRKVEDPLEIEIGKHGIQITRGMKRGVLLPQVAMEHGFDRAGFLEAACVKAGLPERAWTEGAAICVFDAEILKER